MADRTRNRLTTTAVLGLGLMLGLGVIFAGCSTEGPALFSEDEPPIRVRGGSIHIDLLGGGFEFEEHGPRDKKNWKIKNDPQRGRAEYTVAVVSDSPECPSAVVRASSVTITYSEGGQVVEFAATGQATKVKSSQPLDRPSGQPRRLEYASGGYISGVTAGGKTCTFMKADPSLRVYLLD